MEKEWPFSATLHSLHYVIFGPEGVSLKTIDLPPLDARHFPVRNAFQRRAELWIVSTGHLKQIT